MHVHSRAYVCIISEKTKGKFPGELHVVWIGKQNIAAEKVYLSWGGGGGVNKMHYRVSVKKSISLLLSYFHTESLFPKYLNYNYLL